MANDRARTKARAKNQNLQLIQGQGIEMNNVVELQKILLAVNKLREERQINELVEQMKEMEKNYESVVQELAGVKEQLKELTNEAPKGKITEVVNDTIAQAEEKQGILRSIGEELNQKAKNVVQKFKDIGVTALNNVCGFLGLKEKMLIMRDMAQSNAMSMKNSVEKIETIESELAAAKLHVKNIAKAAAGKEVSTVPKKTENKLLGILKARYMRHEKKYSDKVEVLNQAIAKIINLEYKAHEIKGRNKTFTNSEKSVETVKQAVEEKTEQSEAGNEVAGGEADKSEAETVEKSVEQIKLEEQPNKNKAEKQSLMERLADNKSIVEARKAANEDRAADKTDHSIENKIEKTEVQHNKEER